MMNQFKSLLIGFIGILLMTFLVFVPMNAKAATITNGQSTKLLNKGKQFYKFTLEDDALVQISWSKNSDNTAKCYLYNDKDKMDFVTQAYMGGTSGKTFRALPKGTYYVDMYDTNSTPTAYVKFNWTLASTYDKGNYSKITAQALKADTIVHVPQVKKYSYTRWYKIKLTKAQVVTIKTPYGNNAANTFGGIFLLNVQARRVECNYDSKQIETLGFIPAGTYYIVVSSADNEEDVGEYVAFKWK